jgi:hypothetical protein
VRRVIVIYIHKLKPITLLRVSQYLVWILPQLGRSVEKDIWIAEDRFDFRDRGSEAHIRDTR